MLIHVDKYILIKSSYHDSISCKITGINWCCSHMKACNEIRFDIGEYVQEINAEDAEKPCLIFYREEEDECGVTKFKTRINHCPFCGEKIEIIIVNEIDKTEDYKNAGKEIEALKLCIKNTDSKREEEMLRNKIRSIEKMTNEWWESSDLVMRVWDDNDKTRESIPPINQHFDDQKNNGKIPLKPHLAEKLAEAQRRTPEESAEIVKRFNEIIEEREKNPLISKEAFQYMAEEWGWEFPVELPKESIYEVINHICQYDRHGDKLSDWANKQLGAWFDDPVNWDLLFYEWDYDMKIDYWDSIHEAIGHLEEEVSPLNKRIEHLKQIDKYIGQQYGEELRREKDGE